MLGGLVCCAENSVSVCVSIMSVHQAVIREKALFHNEQQWESLITQRAGDQRVQ